MKNRDFDMKYIIFLIMLCGTLDTSFASYYLPAKCEKLPIDAKGFKDKIININKNEILNNNIRNITKCVDIDTTVYTGLGEIIPLGNKFCAYKVFVLSIQSGRMKDAIKRGHFEYFEDEISPKHDESCPDFDAKSYMPLSATIKKYFKSISEVERFYTELRRVMDSLVERQNQYMTDLYADFKCKSKFNQNSRKCTSIKNIIQNQKKFNLDDIKVVGVDIYSYKKKEFVIGISLFGKYIYDVIYKYQDGKLKKKTTL